MTDLAERQVTVRRRFAAIITIVASVAFAGYPAAAWADVDANNVVQVINRLDNSWRTRAKAAVAYEPGPSVTNENIAFARASCTDCRTVAVAVQAIVINGPVDDFQPGNAAVAFNESCLRCQTYAYARQVVLYADGPVWVSDSAKDRLMQIMDQFSAVADSDITFDEMTVALDSLTVEAVSILQAEIEQSGQHATERSDRRIERDD